ncbi:hypothetical protein V8E53_012775 [Lactarius tabidus]
MPLKNSLGEFSGGSDTLILGPGYVAVGNGQVALPGSALDGPPPISQSAPSMPFLSAPSQNAITSSSSSPPTALPGMSVGSSAISVSSLAVLPSISASLPPSLDVSSTTFSSDKPWTSQTSSIFPTSTSLGTITTTPLLTSVTSSTLPSISPVAPAVAMTSDNEHGASFWAGIALLTIAGIATIITLFAWWLRVRSRSRRRPWESGWRWGRTENCPEDAISSSGDSTDLWQQLAESDSGERRHSTSHLLSSYRKASYDLSLPAPAAFSPFMRGPYPTLRPLPLGMRHSDTSVPGVMQDIGSLRVANLVAGDILTSGDESSRPPTALDDVGTPRESSVMPKPRYLGLNGSGLDMPRILIPQSPLQHEPSRPPPLPPPRPLRTPLSGNRWKERVDRSSAKPTEPRAIETWQDSLRSNIANALGMFTAVTLAPVHPGSSTYGSVDPNLEIGRASSPMSTASKPWTLEETREGAGIVHIRGAPNGAHIAPSLHSTTTSVSRRRTRGSAPRTPTSFRQERPPLPLASLVPPFLPHLPPMPEVPRTNAARSKSTKGQHGSRRLRQLGRGFSSSASSATSVGSDMSRSSGGVSMARWSRLSEKEEAARHALRQRRLQSLGSSRS